MFAVPPTRQPYRVRLPNTPNVATITDKKTWFCQSRKKLRSTRGEYCDDDSWRATSVSPRTSAITVTTVPVIPIRSVRASSAVPWNSRCCRGAVAGTCTLARTAPSTSAAISEIPGSTHSAPRAYSHNPSVRRRVTTPAPRPATGAGNSRPLRGSSATSRACPASTGSDEHAVHGPDGCHRASRPSRPASRLRATSVTGPSPASAAIT